MMLHGASGRAILTKSVEDRWRGELIATSILGVFLLGGLAAYRQIDLSIYTDMPVAIRAVMHVPDGADVAALAYGVIYSFIAAMTLAGLAVSMGASTIAGEERDGTLGLLLANPTTRSHVLRAKIVAMVTVTSIGALLLLVAARIAPAVAGVAIGSSDLVALMVHMWANALVFGFLAVAIGAWTGNRSLASACSAGIMVLSYFAVGLLPLSASLAGLAKFFPWYWFDGGAPMAQGINGRHLLLEAATIGLCVTFAFIGLNRRDLRRGGAGGIATLVDRLRANPSTKKVMDRLAGQARVSHIWVKAASERQGLLVIASVAMFAMMGIMMGIMYAAIDDALATMSKALPEIMLAMVGGGDMSTPEGFFQLETFGIMAPAAVMMVTVAAGARALAGEESDRTMGLLLANPVPRSRVVLHKAAAMGLHGVVVGVATFAGVVGGSVVAGLGMSVGNIAATCVMVTLLGIMFGALALAIGAGTGRVRAATIGTVGIAGAAYMANAILPVVDSLSGWARLSPFHWYLGEAPLVNGMPWGLAALFGVAIAMLTAAAVLLFDQRDLHRD